jgi:hypothetical protein
VTGDRSPRDYSTVQLQYRFYLTGNWNRTSRLLHCISLESPRLERITRLAVPGSAFHNSYSVYIGRPSGFDLASTVRLSSRNTNDDKDAYSRADQ